MKKLAMKVLITILKVLFTCGLGDSSAIAKSSRPTKPPDVRVVGGVPAKIEDFPFYVLVKISLQDHNNFHFAYFCGGSIISPRWVLTAAHCFDFKVDYTLTMDVIAGTDKGYDYILNTVATKIPVEAQISHPKYNVSGNGEDISLLYLSKPLEWSKIIRPISLPLVEYEENNFNSALVMGFGKTNPNITETQWPNSQLMVAKLTMFNSNEEICTNQENFMAEIMICAGWRQGGKDACKGDSGGPLVVQRRPREYFVAGIVSWGVNETCGERGLPAFYTRVSHYLNWIDQTMNGYK